MGQFCVFFSNVWTHALIDGRAKADIGWDKKLCVCILSAYDVYNRQ